jgi:hypothetical protein
LGRGRGRWRTGSTRGAIARWWPSSATNPIGHHSPNLQRALNTLRGHQDGRLKRLNERDDETTASIASVEIVTRRLGDDVVEYGRRIELWDKGKALEQLNKHLGLVIRGRRRGLATVPSRTQATRSCTSGCSRPEPAWPGNRA